MATRYLRENQIKAIKPSEYKRYIWAYNDGQGDTTMTTFDKLEREVMDFKSNPTIIDILDYIWNINKNGNMCDFGYIKDDHSLEKIWLFIKE